MSKRVIKVTLSEKSIDNAIKELKNYKTWLKECTVKFIQALGEEGVQVATAKFQTAVYDGTNDVSVSVESRDNNKVAVVAVGSSVLFIEFGTGVKYPYNHPEAGKNGFTRGGYGYKLGRLENGWRYTGDPGSNGEVITTGKHAGEVHTYGNPANMSMYETVRELEEKFEEIARRCYTWKTLLQEVSKMATSTYMTFLMHKNQSTWEKLLDITEFPDLGGDPELLETTTLSDKMQTYVNGVQSNDGMTFNANYDHTEYKALKALEGKNEEYAVWFGGTETASSPTPTGSEGKFKFAGELSVYVTGGGVNEVRGMAITIAPSTPITEDEE